MILTCPACATRYRVSEQELAAPAGRMVRCANCGEIWKQAPPPPSEMRRDQAISIGASSHDEPARQAAAAPVTAPRLDIRPRPQPAPPPATARRRPGRAMLGRAMAAILVLVVLGVLAGIIGRGHVVAAWPPAGRLFASIGLTAEPAAAGLEIDKLVPVRTADGLTIDGEIANRGTAPEAVPRLRVALQDAAKQEVRREIIDPPKVLLQPGEVEHFATSFAHLPGAATGVVVTFASR